MVKKQFIISYPCLIYSHVKRQIGHSGTEKRTTVFQMQQWWILDNQRKLDRDLGILFFGKREWIVPANSVPAAAGRQKGQASCNRTRCIAWFCILEKSELLRYSQWISQMRGYWEERHRWRHKHLFFLSIFTEVRGSKRIRHPCSPDRQPFLCNRTPGDTAATPEIKAIGSDQHMRWSMRFNATIPEKPYHFFNFLKLKN